MQVFSEIHAGQTNTPRCFDRGEQMICKIQVSFFKKEKKKHNEKACASKPSEIHSDWVKSFYKLTSIAEKRGGKFDIVYIDFDSSHGILSYLPGSNLLSFNFANHISGIHYDNRLAYTPVPKKQLELF